MVPDKRYGLSFAAGRDPDLRSGGSGHCHAPVPAPQRAQTPSPVHVRQQPAILAGEALPSTLQNPGCQVTVCSKQQCVASISNLRAFSWLRHAVNAVLECSCLPLAALLPRCVVTCQSYFCLSSAEPCLLRGAVQAPRRAGLGARAQPSQTRQLPATREDGRIDWSFTATVSVWDCLNTDSRGG